MIFFVLHISYPLTLGQEWTKLVGDLFSLTSRTIWGCCIAWIILACHYGYGGNYRPWSIDEKFIHFFSRLDKYTSWSQVFRSFRQDFLLRLSHSHDFHLSVHGYSERTSARQHVQLCKSSLKLPLSNRLLIVLFCQIYALIPHWFLAQVFGFVCHMLFELPFLNIIKRISRSRGGLKLNADQSNGVKREDYNDREQKIDLL